MTFEHDVCRRPEGFGRKSRKVVTTDWYVWDDSVNQWVLLSSLSKDEVYSE